MANDLSILSIFQVLDFRDLLVVVMIFQILNVYIISFDYHKIVG